MAYDFSKAEDRKEFLDKLGTEYRFGCFNENRPHCKYLATSYKGYKYYG